MKARDYQIKAFSQIINSKNRLINLNLYMGLGKTKVISMLVEHYEKEKEKVLIMTTVSALISQIANHLKEPPNIIKQGMDQENKNSSIYLASEQSLFNRYKQYEDLKNCIIIKDEAIGFNQKRTTELFKFFEPKKVIVSSATFYDERGITLSKNAQIVHPIKYEEALKKGYTTPVKYYVPTFTKNLKLEEVSKVGNDYNQDELTTIMSKKWFLDSFAKWFTTIEPNKRDTMIICTNIDHLNIVEKTLKSSEYTRDLKIGSVHSKKSDKENEKIINCYKNGNEFEDNKINVLISVSKLNIGFDAPNTVNLVWLRPTLVKRLWVQGQRNTRVHINKKIAYTFDLGNCLAEHGFPNDEYYGAININEYRKYKNKNSITEIDLIINQFKDKNNIEINYESLKVFRKNMFKIYKNIDKLDLKNLLLLYDVTPYLEYKKLFKIAYYMSKHKTSRIFNKESTVKWALKQFHTKLQDVSIFDRDLILKVSKKRLKDITLSDRKIAAMAYYIDYLVDDSNLNVNWKYGDENEEIIPF